MKPVSGDKTLSSASFIFMDGWMDGCTYCFLGLRMWYMEVPRLGVESKLQLLVYTTATATLDRSRVCDLHHSSWQHRILNPLSEARREATSSWILVGFITTEPQREHLHFTRGKVSSCGPNLSKGLLCPVRKDSLQDDRAAL